MLILLHIPLFSLQNFEEFSHGKVFHAQQSQEKKNSLGAKFFTAPVPEYRARTLEEFNARVPNFQSEESGLFDDLQPGQIDPFINQQELNIGQTVPVFPVQSKSVRVNPYPKKNPRKRSPLINGQSAVPTSTPVSWTWQERAQAVADQEKLDAFSEGETQEWRNRFEEQLQKERKEKQQYRAQIDALPEGQALVIVPEWLQNKVQVEAIPQAELLEPQVNQFIGWFQPVIPESGDNAYTSTPGVPNSNFASPDDLGGINFDDLF